MKNAAIPGVPVVVFIGGLVVSGIVPRRLVPAPAGIDVRAGGRYIGFMMTPDIHAMEKELIRLEGRINTMQESYSTGWEAIRANMA
ncbi:MAG: hypothetical protein GDA53_09140, partial [Rhodobacteraceae bacterium]|nr:hypothetical protein [Paracoccaceae bacterium]